MGVRAIEVLAALASLDGIRAGMCRGTMKKTLAANHSRPTGKPWQR